MIFVDVSHWNPEAAKLASRVPDADLDWNVAVAHGLWGAVVKFSQGTNYFDPAALLHSSNAAKAKVPLIGAYHFGSGENGAVQAKWFLSCLREAGLNLAKIMVMLDAERNPDQMYVADAVLFMETVHNALGRWPWLYMGKSGMDGTESGLPNSVLSDCKLVVPAFGDHAGNLGAILPPGWALPSSATDNGTPNLGVLRGWQFTDGVINGGPYPGLGVVDQSTFVGVATLDEARAIWTT